ncbi:MAG: class I adenylate-forming enzyme family protein [Gammaproteobacteria bacterium]
MPSNLWSLIEPSLRRYAEHNAWICRQRDGNREVKYRQIHDAALCTAHDLRAAGVEQGDTVGITAPNGPEWTVAALAAFRIGSPIAPIHIGNSEHEIQAQIAAVNPKVMLVHESELEHHSKIAIKLQSDREKISVETTQNAADDPSSVAARIYSSGSTGNPKVVKLSHCYIASNVLAAVNLESFNAEDKFISLLPFSHAMGITGNVNLPYYVGATLVSPKVLAANEILATLQEEKVSVVIAVPRLFRNVMLGMEKKFASGGKGLVLYRKLLKSMPKNMRRYLNAPVRSKLGGNIKIWVSGGSHLDGRISRYYHDLGLPLRQGYGLTETSPLSCVQDNFDDAVESVGRPIEQVEVKIVDPDENGNGEVWIRGPNVMLGYEDEAQNKEALQDGWFKTGDIATLDAKGRVTLTGRSKRLIVTEAGKNVYPEELETLLERDPMVKEAGVLEAEMKPVCILSMEGNDPASEARRVLKDFNRLVSKHNQITRFAIIDELPRTPLGKMALQELPHLFQQFEIKGT